MTDTPVAPFMSRRAFVATAGAASAVANAAGSGAAEAPSGVPSGLPPGSNFGQSDGDKALLEAWNQFCDRLRDSGANAFKSTITPAPLVRADAFRFLLQNLGQSFTLGFETKNTKFPVIHTFCT